jgi:hypothetical protein
MQHQYPLYGNCEHYIYTKSATSANYPRISFAQLAIGLNTVFEIYMDMGIGGNSSGSGVLHHLKGVVFVNGTAPFVYDGQYN